MTSLNPYLPLLIVLLFSIVFASVVSLASWLIGPRRYDPVKHATYECGMPMVTTSRERMSVKFYLTAILFILFDIETVFLFVWARTYDWLGLLGFIEIVSFMTILLVGYVYVVRRGALEWE